MEQLKDVPFSQLGTGDCGLYPTSPTENNIDFGDANKICRQRSLNIQGNTCETANFPNCKDPNEAGRPFLFTRYLSVCNEGSGIQPGGVEITDPCNFTSWGTHIPKELACGDVTVNPGEIAIRVFVTWYNKQSYAPGDLSRPRCRSVALTTTVVDI